MERLGLYRKKPEIDSLMKAYHFDIDAFEINLTSSTVGDDQQTYNRPSDAMHHMDNSGEKDVCWDFLQSFFVLSAEVGESYSNRFLRCLLKRSRSIESFLQLFTAVPKMRAFVRTRSFKRILRKGFMEKRLTTALESNNVFYVKDTVAVCQNQTRQTMDDEIMAGS